MSKHTLFQRTSLSYGLLFVGFLISFLKCESLEDPFIQKKESSEARKIETVSLEEAKNFFLSKHSKNEKKTNQHINYAVEEPNHSLKLTPDWTTLQHKELFEINHAKLTSADVEVNRAGLFESQLIFIKVNNEIKNAIYTIYRDKLSDNGKLIRGRVYLNQTNGLFLDGFKIENGLFSKRFVVKSIGVQKASLMELLIQTVTTDDDCWNTDMLEGMEGGVELEEVEVIGTTGGDYGNSDNTGAVYSIIRGWNNNYSENNHRSIGGGGYGGVMGSVYANDVETEDTEDEEEEEEEEEEPCKTSKSDLKKVFPNTPDATLESLANHINTHAKDFGIDTKEKLQHFLAQAAHESTNYAGTEFGDFEENLNYRWKKLGEKDYWDYYFNPISDPTADPNKENPNDFKRNSTSSFVDVEKFANYVYNDKYRRYKLGNTQTGDGYKYRGRGIIQLTGRANYQSFTNFYQRNYDSPRSFITNPELIASDKELAVISALWFFKNNVLDKTTVDKNVSVLEITELINGGDKGIEHRKEITKKTKKEIDCN